jgi:hypothetical protein
MGKKDVNRLVAALREELDELGNLSGFRFHRRLPIVQRMLGDLQRMDKRAAREIESDLVLLRRNAATIGRRAMSKRARTIARKALGTLKAVSAEGVDREKLFSDFAAEMRRMGWQRPRKTKIRGEIHSVRSREEKVNWLPGDRSKHQGPIGITLVLIVYGPGNVLMSWMSDDWAAWNKEKMSRIISFKDAVNLAKKKASVRRKKSGYSRF